MANEIKGRKIPLYLEELEAKELDRLIDEDILADKESAKLGNRLKEAVRKFRADKRAVILFILAPLVLFAGGWGLSLILSHDGAFIKGDEAGIEARKNKKTQSPKPVVFELETFFLPLIKNGTETGKFITVKAELIVSNERVLIEVEQALPLIRQNIYAILKRKKSSDFLQRKKPIEERIKREIIASTNTTLISGVGSIEDVFFSQFIVQ